MKTLSFSKTIAIGALLICGIVALPPVVRANPDHRTDRERIQTVIIGKFASEMDLTPEQAEKFFPRLRVYQDRLEGIQRAERDARMELDQLSRTPNGDRDRLNRLLGERRRLDSEAAELKQGFLNDISSFLSPQQVSRCSILLDDLPHRVRGFIQEKQREKGQSISPQQQQRRSRQPEPLPRRRGR